MGSGKRDILERVSWWLTLTACLTALLACIAAPLLAISWSKRPFPGFMVEPTLVVNDSDGEGWSGRVGRFRLRSACRAHRRANRRHTRRV